MILIPLDDCVSAKIDDIDAPLVLPYKWHVHRGRSGDTYAMTRIGGRGGRYTSMHRIIMRPANGVLVDHINGDGLDNRRSNLRACTHAENMRNSKPRTGRFKGVSLTRHGTFRAVIHEGKKQHHLGLFGTEEEAAHAYDRAASDLHGEFARLNFPVEATQ